MSYDLFFWREKPGVRIDPDVISLVQDADDLFGLIPLPREEVVEAFREHFPEIEEGNAELGWEGDGSYFQVGFTFLDEQHVSVGAIFCGYELLKSQSAMRRIERVTSELGCRLHDPQRG